MTYIYTQEEHDKAQRALKYAWDVTRKVAAPAEDKIPIVYGRVSAREMGERMARAFKPPWSMKPHWYRPPGSMVDRVYTIT